MIVFEEIKWKNFLSTGNSFTEVKIDDAPSHLILGSNGAGKSTLLDALCFVLFNKPFRKIIRRQLINSINERECLVEIKFYIGSVKYKVIRGIKPNVFEIYRNGQLLDQDAANKDYQAYLEKSILKFNFKSFTQVVILGSSTFVPFMQLTAPNRREVIEDLLDIQIFSRMNLLLKDRVKDIKDNQKECEHLMQIAEQQVAMQKNTIDNMEKMNDDYMKRLHDQFDENEKRIAELSAEVDSKKILIEEYGLKVNNMPDNQKMHEELRDMRAKIKSNLKRAEKEVAFYKNNDECPTCTQKLPAKLKKKNVESAEERVEKMTGGLDDITVKINDCFHTIKQQKEICDKITTVQTEILGHQRETESLLIKSKKILTDTEAEAPDVKKEKTKLSDFVKNHKKTAKDCAKVNHEADNLKTVSSLLRDGGIKSRIIAKFIPIINQRINKYLQSMDFFVNFTLDEEFNEIIKSRFRDEFSYASFSEGEKQKIDLSLLFTWRDIAKMKNSAATNLLILDEVFDSSLDSASTEELFKILRGLDSKTNFFVISHKGDILLDKFDTTLRFEKVNDFSKVVTDDDS
jgi:DNA repair exonuclease SbcCD ATPase subunit